jgi:pyruvate formate lyase activating enzyme
MSVNKEHCVDCGQCTEVCPTKARELKGKTYTVDEVRATIDKDIDFYRNSGGGITFSGGEPMLKADFIIELAKEYLEKGLTSVVETCGCVPWENFEKAIPYIDMFYYDVKFLNSEKHREHCGAGNEQILSNLLNLCERGCKVMIRIPIIPGINDTEDHFAGIAATAESLQNVQGVEVEPYHPLGAGKAALLGKEYALDGLSFPENETVESWIQKIAAQTGVSVKKG